MLVTDAYAKIKKGTGGLPKRQIVFLANTHPSDRQPSEVEETQEATSPLRVTMGADTTEPLSIALLQAENKELHAENEKLKEQLRALQEGAEEAGDNGSGPSIGLLQHARRTRHGNSSPRQ